MVEDTVIAITQNHDEANQNPGRFKRRIIEFTAKLFNCFRKHQPPAGAAAAVKEERIPKSSGQDSSAAITSPDQGITSASQPPNNSTAEPRNRVQNMWSHPIFLKVQEQELGKFALGLVAQTTIALLTTNGGKSQTVLVHFVITGLSTGFTAIWHGIALRGTDPRTANIIEQVGIVIVMISFKGLVASALPMEFAWVPILWGCSCILPFVIAVLPVKENTAGGD